MKLWRIALRLLRQDWRSGELHLLAAAVVLTVGAITAVGFFTDRVAGAMAGQGGELIAADLVIETRSPIEQGLFDKAHELGLTAAKTLEFSTVIIGDEGPQLIQLKAVESAYPLRGQLRVRASLAAPEQIASAGPPPGEAWVEPRLLYLLRASPGDLVQLGELEVRIGKVLAHEPDRGGGIFQLAPRVLISLADIPATGLVTPLSRVEHRLLIAGEPDRVDRFRAWAVAHGPNGARFVDARDARPELEGAVERASSFLHLATLATLLVAGAAIALASRRMVERQTDAVAVMRCLGAPRHLLTRLFVLRLVLFGLAASLVGSLLGYLAQFGLAQVLAELFATELPPPSLRPLVLGIGTGLIALLGFGLPPLLQLARVPPLRVLRRDLGPPRLSAGIAVAAAAAAMVSLIFWQAGDPRLAWQVLGGVILTLTSLALAVWALVRVARALSYRATGIWRLGLAGLSRRPVGALFQITGFGLGILALLLLAVVRVDLLNTWQQGLPDDAPNRFLVNIQPDQVAAIETFFAERGIRDSGLFPMIRGRLVAIDGQPVVPEEFADPRAERLATREFNLSHAERLQADNRILAGQWWTGPEAPPQFSLEQGLAETLGIRLGDELTFAVAGRELRAPVTSLREVQWDSFNVNFFVIAPPSLLGDEPGTYVTSFHLSSEREGLVPELVRQFPSVTLIDVDALLNQVRQIIDRGVLAVEYVFLFTLAAGLLVMYAGIQASLADRRIEHGILRTLGSGRRQLLGSLAVEFTLAGLVAGLLASIAAELTGYLLATRVFGLEFAFNPWLWTGGVLGSGLLIGLAGVLATYPLLIRPPLHTLRRAD
ncbi:FtsX-like permease family protein [Thioalkalicoccus limnaeus]|uniref:FtsX-like permease family protein n=1 Tax=Thioalkalicoccus limnaeus TaxID=120681 RepID=A0ABV4BHQ2_9GAMM